MSFKELVNQEYLNYKRRMQEETGGTYVLLYIGLVFSVFSSTIYGFHYEKEDYIVLILWAFCTCLLYQEVTLYLSSVKENGKRVNIFEKYVYTPVDFALLQKAKMMVAVRMIGLPIFLSQFVSCAVCIIDPDQDGGSLLELNVWIPLLTGGIFFLSKLVEYRKLRKKGLFI